MVERPLAAATSTAPVGRAPASGGKANAAPGPSGPPQSSLPPLPLDVLEADALRRRFGDVDFYVGYKAVRHHLRAAAARYDVDYDLLKAVIAVETRFEPSVVSPRGAVGLMQLMPVTARFHAARDGRLSPEDPGQGDDATLRSRLADPQFNIQLGARHLAYLLKRFDGDLSLALAAYNAGPDAVHRAGNRIPNLPQTRQYVHSVLGLYRLLHADAHAPAPALSGLPARIQLPMRSPVPMASNAVR